MADGDDKAGEVFDANKFKQEILEANRGIVDDLKGEITASVQTMLAEHAEKTRDVTPAKREKITNESLEDFRQELEDIGIDEAQGDALVRMVQKVFIKNTADLEDKVVTKASKIQDDKETIKGLTIDTQRKFPDIKNKTSALFKESQKQWQGMSKQMQQAPDAEAIAVERAALKLNVRPLSIEDINAWDAQNPNGGGGGSKSKKKEMNPELMKFFNVDPKKVNEKLKEKGYFN